MLLRIFIAIALLVGLNCQGQPNRDSYVNKFKISRVDSAVWLEADMKKDHRVFGYESASVKSAKLILFSIFTTDVENNRGRLRYGAYYQTSNMDGMQMKLLKLGKVFAEIALLRNDTLINRIYFHKQHVRFRE